MKKLLALVFLLVQCDPSLARSSATLDIKLIHDSDTERRTKLQVERLLNTYDTDRWIFTTKIAIETGAIPHSHPVLTLNSRHLNNDHLLLSTFLHEQLHWFLDGREKAASLAVDKLKLAFPSLPTGYPEGADTEQSNYEHLIVIFLEYKAIRQLLGDSAALETMNFWAADHYKKLYSTVLDNQDLIGSIVSTYRLLP